MSSENYESIFKTPEGVKTFKKESIFSEPAGVWDLRKLSAEEIVRKLSGGT